MQCICAVNICYLICARRTILKKKTIAKRTILMLITLRNTNNRKKNVLRKQATSDDGAH